MRPVASMIYRGLVLNFTMQPTEETNEKPKPGHEPGATHKQEEEKC